MNVSAVGDDNDNDDLQPSVTYCAIRPGPGSLLKEPAIFFGKEDIKLFLEYLKQQQQQQKQANASDKGLANVAGPFEYKVFGTLAAALEYVQKQTETTTTTASSTATATAETPAENATAAATKNDTNEAMIKTNTTITETSVPPNKENDDSRPQQPTTTTTAKTDEVTAGEITKTSPPAVTEQVQATTPPTLPDPSTKEDSSASAATANQQKPTPPDTTKKPSSVDDNTATTTTKTTGEKGTSLVVAAETNDPKLTQQEQEIIVSPTPKRRGRPPKRKQLSPPPPASSSLSTPKKRGRPRKQQSSPSTFSIPKLSVAQVATAVLGPPSTTASPPRKKRKVKQDDPKQVDGNDKKGGKKQKMSLPVQQTQQDARWEERFALLRIYKEHYGNCHVPSLWNSSLPELYKPLPFWIKKQRQEILEYEEERKKKRRLEKKKKAKKNTKDDDDGGESSGDDDDDDNDNDNEEYDKYDEDETHPIAIRKKRLMELGFLVDKWELKFQLLKQYKEEHGDCNVPLGRKNPNVQRQYKCLQSWVTTQRKLLDDPSAIDDPSTPMTEDRKQRLLDLGFLRKNELKELERERKKPGRAALSPEELEQRRKEKFQSTWEERFNLLREYKEEHGTFVVPIKIAVVPDKYKPLVQWIKQLREHIKLWDEDPSKSFLTVEQRQRCRDIGLYADSRMVLWEEKFQLLRKYKDEFGNCDVPCTTKNPELLEKYGPLFAWAGQQRRVLREFENDSSKPIPPVIAERRRRLFDIGFRLDVEDLRKKNRKAEPVDRETKLKNKRYKKFNNSFPKWLERLKEFKEKHGHVNVPSKTTLYAWLGKQRKAFEEIQEGKENHLKLEHIMALTNLGYSFSYSPKRPLDRGQRVKDYVEWVKTHDGNFPDRKSADDYERSLAGFEVIMRKRRSLFAKGIKSHQKHGVCEIAQEHIDALDSVGFRWKLKEHIIRKKMVRVPFEVKFEQLKKYKAKHGHCEPPKCHPKLGNFVFGLRKQYRFLKEGKKSNLTAEKFRLLSDVGFRFKPSENGCARKNYVDGDSSGYDTSDEEDEDDDDNNDDVDDDESNTGDDNGGDDDDDEGDDANDERKEMAGTMSIQNGRVVVGETTGTSSVASGMPPSVARAQPTRGKSPRFPFDFFGGMN